MSHVVSFLIAAFNEENFIRECIDSCLDQSYSNIEVVVVDDGSTDSTAQVLNSYTDKRIKFIHFSENRGKVAAFNAAFEASTGGYLCLIGADDVNYLNRVTNSLVVLQRESVDLVVGDMEVCDVELNHLSVIGADVDWDIYDLMVGNRMGGGCSLFTRKLGSIIFPIPEVLRFEDWWISFIASLHGTFRPVGAVVVKYRQHDANGVGVSGSIRDRRIRDWTRHDTYYAEFNRFLSFDFAIQNHKLTVHIQACQSMKRMYLEKNFINRIEIFRNAKTPFRWKWKIAYLLTFIFGATGYDSLVALSVKAKSLK